jgi:hypothetical protein
LRNMCEICNALLAWSLVWRTMREHRDRRS